MSATFSSDGFDLDALPATGQGTDDVIYEVGGKATAVAPPADEDTTQEEEESPLAQSEEFKARGNEEFKNQNYLEAYDLYTSAIDACPGMTGKELLALRDEFDAVERKRLHEIHRLETAAKAGNNTNKDKKDDDVNQGEAEPPKEVTPESKKPRDYVAPPHPHGTELAIYHCNRAACSLYLKNYEDALVDCDVAILLRPTWPKAFQRRSMAYENLEEQTDKALDDAKKALELEPTNVALRKNVARLQKIEDERLEKLKEETLGKLKDLGNTILGNFGLSLDNFVAQQDPNTGSYSISFNQGAKK